MRASQQSAFSPAFVWRCGWWDLGKWWHSLVGRRVELCGMLRMWSECESVLVALGRINVVPIMEY